MARQYSKEQIQELRARIREAHQLYPRIGEREIYEQLLQDYPHSYGPQAAMGTLPYSRFRNHYDIAIRKDAPDTASPGIPPRPGAIDGETTLERFLAGRRILAQAEERRRVMAALLEEANQDLIEISIEMTQLAEALKDETAAGVRGYLPGDATNPRRGPGKAGQESRLVHAE